MKKLIQFCFVAALFVTFAACENDPNVDPRNAFVGAYSYEASGNVIINAGPLHYDIPLNEQGTFTISKKGVKDSVVIEGYNSPINATVSGTQLILESTEYDTMYGDISLHLSLSHGKAKLSNNQLSWESNVNAIGRYSGFSAAGEGTVAVAATKISDAK